MSEVHHHNITEPILIVGIQIRTNNALELSGKGQISHLWHRFFAEKYDAQIPDRIGNDLYVVYSNYESDEYGEYDYLIGAAASSVESLPVGMTFAAVATGDYAIVTTDKGAVEKMVPGKWKEIWQMPAEELGGKRAFLTDYEIYGSKATNPYQAEVDIYLGLEPEAD